MNNYTMSAEAPRDVAGFLQAVDVRVMSYSFDPGNGCDVLFSSPQSLAVIRAAISQIEDGHVMLRTLTLVTCP